MVEILLSRNSNREHRNVSDYTPLSLAASGGYVNIIKLLLAHGAEINSRTGEWSTVAQKLCGAKLCGAKLCGANVLANALCVTYSARKRNDSI